MDNKRCLKDNKRVFKPYIENSDESFDTTKSCGWVPKAPSKTQKKTRDANLVILKCLHLCCPPLLHLWLVICLMVNKKKIPNDNNIGAEVIHFLKINK